MENDKYKNPYLSDNFYNIYTQSTKTQPEWEASNFSVQNDSYGNVFTNQNQQIYYPPDPYNLYGNFNSTYSNQNVDQLNTFQSPMPNFDPNSINNQFVAAGAHLFQNQMSNYSQNLMSKGKFWFNNSLKYYFAVDTTYVLKKILLLFFPYFQKDWSLKYNSNEPIAPRDDLNVPDLYIPTMAFITYILLAGFIFGLKNAFTPEKLGIQASFVIFWLIFEVTMFYLVLYLMGIKNSLGIFHLTSFCGYKFVFMIFLLLSYSLIQKSYYWFLIYSGLSLAYFLARSLNTVIQTTSYTTVQHGVTKLSIYLILGFVLTQPLVMYWMTSKVVFYEVS